MANNGRDFTVQNCELSDNDAALGGGIANFATAKVQGSSFCMNTASSAGGGIYNFTTLTVDNCYFSSNASAYLGGAIANDTTGSATVTDNTSVDSNHAGTAGGGISNLGSLDVSNSTISNNFTTVPTIPTVVVGTGGGIYNTGTLTVESNSCLYGNSANFGGGIFNSGTATVMDSFVTCNSANVEGGGIDNFGPASVLYVTNSFVENNTAPAGTGQDLHNDGSATLSSSDVDDIQTDLGGNTTVISPRGD